MDASENMELYDIETGTEPYLEGVWIAWEVSENSTSEAMTEAVYQKTKEMLKNEGIEVARRTVAKYRESLHIPSSSERKVLI